MKIINQTESELIVKDGNRAGIGFWNCFLFGIGLIASFYKNSFELKNL